ncbi:MAG TPA: twin-arginine translocase subunit TatC, partial [Thiolinea sp.]|nr:twin-arginine translocase subunit TatC [Thiolinea sp.]
MASGAEANEEQGFLSHLIELRDRLLRMVIAVGAAFICLFPFAKNLYNILADPLVSKVAGGMIITGTADPFLVPLKLALLVAFFIALPYVLYQLWAFVAPGLYRHEKRLAVPMLVSSVLLFYLGALFAYFVLLPLMFTVLPSFVPEVATYSPDIG